RVAAPYLPADDWAVPDIFLLVPDTQQISQVRKWSGISRELEVPLLYLSSQGSSELIPSFPNLGSNNFLSLPANDSSLRAALAPYTRPKRKGNRPMQDGHLLLKTSDNVLERVAFTDILVLEAVGNYCHFYTTNKRYTHRMPLKNYSQVFPESQFVRVHRNFVINLHYLTSIALQKGVVEVAGKPYPLSQKYKNDLLTRFPKV
ncbi:MAG: LytTR family DNA-binding domain-containing protein, partial [Bacteroidota bacterium]